MAWTSEDVKKLILTIKEYPILYNRDLPTDLDAHADAISKIQPAMDRPWSVIRKKWSELRHYHKTNYLDHINGKKHDKPKWKYYDMMEFAIDSEYRFSSKYDNSSVSI